MNRNAATRGIKNGKNAVVKNGFGGDRLAPAGVITDPLTDSEAATSTATDPILYWNAVALEANRVSHSTGFKDKKENLGPTLSSRALAIVHLAMYDAYAGVMGNPAELPAYLPGLPTPIAGASADVAVAAAAYYTLSALYPSQRAFFSEEWARANLNGPGFDEGRNYGIEVARRILADRKDDPNADDAGYAPSTNGGAHRPDPNDHQQGFHAPFYGAGSKGFAISTRFELDAHPSLTNAEYLAALKEVWGKGIAPEQMGTLPLGITPRTPEETMIGIFWAYDGANEIGTPPRLYNQIVRKVAIAQGNSIAQNARLFAMVNAAMADAGILAWAEKYRHNLWRPVVGIQENGLPNSDPFWLPLGAPKSNELAKNTTPAFPAYPSGHATFGAAALHMTRLFYGDGGTLEDDNLGSDNLFDGLTFVSDELNGHTTDNRGTVRSRIERDFPGGLWQMIEENGRSRVYLGVHWVFDAFAVDSSGAFDLTRPIGGVWLGLKIAEDIFNNGLTKSSV